MTLEVRNLDKEADVRAFEHGKTEVAKAGSVVVGRATLDPGWRWSTSVKPIVGTDSCQVHHKGYVISGGSTWSWTTAPKATRAPGTCTRSRPATTPGWSATSHTSALTSRKRSRATPSHARRLGLVPIRRGPHAGHQDPRHLGEHRGRRARLDLVRSEHRFLDAVEHEPVTEAHGEQQADGPVEVPLHARLPLDRDAEPHSGPDVARDLHRVRPDHAPLVLGPLDDERRAARVECRVERREHEPAAGSHQGG